MKAILDAIKGSPWWVYVLFFYLLWIGIKALKPQVLSLKKIFIIPLVFFIWGMLNLIMQFQGYKDILVWLIFLIIGYFIGWGINQMFKIRADKKKLLIKIPGSPIVLILILLIFGTKYFFGYYRATHVEMAPLIHFANLIASGLFTGVFIGRTLSTLKKFAQAQHEKLKESNS